MAHVVETLSRPTSSQKHKDEAWRMERLMFWCSEDQMRIFQEAFEKDKRLFQWCSAGVLPPSGTDTAQALPNTSHILDKSSCHTYQKKEALIVHADNQTT